MALNNALFRVNRGGVTYKVSGSNIGDKIRNGDQVLVQRGSDHFKATYGNSSWDKIADNDLLLAWDGSNNRKVRGSNFKALFRVTAPPTATISSDKTTIAEGETYRISWSASGGSSYKLHDSADGSRSTVSANSYRDITALSSAMYRYFTIEVYDSNGNQVKTASFSVRQLGSGYKWVYAASVPLGGSGKWSHGEDKTKFHNTDADGNDVESWWRSFSSGTRRIKLGSTYQDFYFPSPSTVNSGSGKSTHFSTLNLTGGIGTEIIIFNK